MSSTANTPNGLVGSLIVLQPGPDQTAVRNAFSNNQFVKLKINESHHRLFGYNGVQILAFGTGLNQEPTETWTIAPHDPAHTINGRVQVSLRFKRPTLIVATYQGHKKWLLTAFESNVGDLMRGVPN